MASGVATHTAGTASDLAQDLTLTEGTTYRIAYTVSGMTAGSITPALTGGTTAYAGTAVGTDGTYHDAIVAGADNTAFALQASANFDGSIDAVTVYSVTSACLDQTTYNVWLTSVSSSGVPADLVGPFSAEVL